MSRIFSRPLVFGLALLSGVFGFVALILLAPETRAASGINRQINYQAKLLDSSGLPVADGTYSINFSLYDTATGGTRLWTATGTLVTPTALSVSVQNGLFTVLLGDTSSTGGWQNDLNTVAWNQDALYLGVTVSADSEMAPRKRLASAPQAFNAEQLQGMYASGTAFGTSNVFAIHQTSATAATGTRAALQIKTSGTSDVNDFLLRGLDGSDNAVFSINRLGDVTSTGYLAVTSTATSTFAGSIKASGNVSTTNAIVSNFFNVYGTSTLLNNVLIGASVYSNELNSAFALNGNDLFVAGNIGSASSVYTNGAFVAGVGSTSYQDGNITKNNGNMTLFAYGGFFAPTTDRGVTLGSSTQRWDGNFGYATATNFTVTNAAASLIGSDTLFTDVTGTTVGSGPMNVVIQGKFAYIPMSVTKELAILDVTNPSATTSKQTVPNSFGAESVAANGDYAYLVGGGRLMVIDTHLPNPRLVFTLSLGGGCAGTAIYVNGRYAYVSCPSKILTIDVSNPQAPAIISELSTPEADTGEMTSDGRYLFVPSSSTLLFVDLRNPANPVTASSITAFNRIRRIAVKGHYAYVADWNGGKLWVVDFATSTPSIAGSVAVSTPWDVDIAGRYAFVSHGGATQGVSVFDISDPTTPTLVRDVTILAVDPYNLTVAGRYIYISFYTSGRMDILDMGGMETSGLIAASAELGSLQVQHNGTIAHDLSVNGSLRVGHGGLSSDGGMTASASSTSSTVSFTNAGTNAQNTTWGAYIDKLLVGSNANATGTADFISTFVYGGGAGICVDDTNTSPTCFSAAGVSIQADGAVNASAFDLAERYAISGTVTSADLLVLDATASSTVKQSPGTPYDPFVIGIASANPGFLLGFGSGPSVALTGRVPLKVTAQNGAIRVGDPIASSMYAGYGMKATKPGMIVGYALEDANATSTIEVFVKVGYEAKMVLGTDASGSLTQFTDDVVFAAKSAATAAQPAQDSWGLTFRGSAWDGSEAITSQFTFLQDVIGATSSFLTVKNTNASSIFQLDQTGDLFLAGRFYPATRGGAQTSTYLFLDDSTSPTSTYIATNADGWQANASYDFAERYYSPDALKPGDLVVASNRGRLHVQRSWDAKAAVLGIVSTRPAFVAGAPAISTYPIALAGRVPTNVSAMNGAIRVGDLLAPSTIPGVAVKATEPGPVAGQALEDYAASDVGKIEVFVNAGWWGGGEQKIVERVITESSSAPAAAPTSYRGFATVAAGATKVHVSYPSLQAYPNVQVTPRGEVVGGWWSDAYTDTGFDLILKQVQTRDIVFAWRVEATADGEQMFLSDGTFTTVNAMTGQAVMTEPAPGQEAEPAAASTTTADTTNETDRTNTTATTEVIPPPSAPVEEPASAPAEEGAPVVGPSSPEPIAPSS